MMVTADIEKRKKLDEREAQFQTKIESKKDDGWHDV